MPEPGRRLQLDWAALSFLCGGAPACPSPPLLLEGTMRWSPRGLTLPFSPFNGLSWLRQAPPGPWASPASVTGPLMGLNHKAGASRLPSRGRLGGPLFDAGVLRNTRQTRDN